MGREIYRWIDRKREEIDTCIDMEREKERDIERTRNRTDRSGKNTKRFEKYRFSKSMSQYDVCFSLSCVPYLSLYPGANTGV